MVSPHPLKIVSLDRRETRELGVNGFAVSAWTEDGIYYHPGPATVARIPASGGVADTLVSGPAATTDGHLWALARRRSARLATLDEGIPDTFLVPS